jgi:SPOR domain
MNRVSIYQIPVAHEVLRGAIAEGEVPPSLVEPMQSLVAALAHRVAESPTRVYVSSLDDAAFARDGFAYVLAKSLMAHVPSVLMVDCDFLKLGLHGLVPQSDALGFLDFLLYGSSIGVVTQESPGGVRVVGAGSFPVTKRMPFVTPAFEDAARRLAAHARAVVYVGPLVQEDGTAHPLATEADLTIVIRGATSAGAGPGRRTSPDVDAIEEAIAGEGVDVWSVRTVPAEAKPRPAVGPREEARASESTPRAAAFASRAGAEKVVPAAPKPVSKPVSKAEPGPKDDVPWIDEPPSRYGALIPRVAVFLFALLVIGFVAWWLWQGRSRPEGDGIASPPAVSTETAEPAALAPFDSAAAALPDSVPAGPRDSVTVAPKTIPASPPVRPSNGGSGGRVLVDPSDILIMDDLASRWNGWFAIHISSFQESFRAREEVSFLLSREFPVFIVFLDLDAKGKWYRVYAGPFETREEAREVKKNLDAIPQVRFTRITQIPE